MKSKELCLILLCLTAVAQHGVSADLSIETSVDPAYYPDLPIHVRYSVVNRGSGSIWVRAAGRGSPWVRPEVIASGAGGPLRCDAYTVRWRDRIELQPGATVSGRVDLACFLPESEEGLNGLAPGEYRVSLIYYFGSNITDSVRSSPQVFVVREPERALEDSRRDYHKLCRAAVASTNIVPASVVPTQVEAANPYSLASHVHYARWLSRRGRLSEALSFWEALLPLGDTTVTDSLQTKEEIAECHIRLKQPEKARPILQEISNQSDIAFGLLQLLDRRFPFGVGPR